MTHTHGSFTCSLVGRRMSFIAALSCVLVALTVSVEAGQQRPRLSKDLSDRLAAGVEAPTDVIVAGSCEQMEALATRYGARIKKCLRNAAVLEVSGGQLRDLSQDAEVANLSGDVPVRPMDDDVTAETIGADQVSAGFGGLKGFTGRGIGVAVIDTGVDATHPYLARRVALSLDFTGASVQRSLGRDENGHGTHVAGIIRDIAPGAHIVDLKAMGAEGSGFTSNVIAALNWAIDEQGGVEPPDRQHLARARRDGVGNRRSAVPGRAAGDRRRPAGDGRSGQPREAPGRPAGRPRDPLARATRATR